MARPREPIDLIMHKGKSHKTKEEIERRKENEVKAYDDDIRPPKFLTGKAQKERFEYIAGELCRIGIMSNLDCDEVGRYIVAQKEWEKYGRLVDMMRRKLSDAVRSGNNTLTGFYTDCLSKYETLRTKAFQQCHTCAASLGLTITSRCRLVIPKTEEVRENKFRIFGKEASG